MDPPFDRTDDIILRNPEGRVPIVLFADYTDPQTRRVRRVLENSSGRIDGQNTVFAVRLVAMDETDPAADIALRAAAAAFWQGRFAEMHEALFASPPDFTREGILDLAHTLGLEIAAFDADLASDRTNALLDRHRASFARSHAAQIPALFINNIGYDGAWDTHSLHEAIIRPIGLRLSQASNDFFHWAASAGLVLVLATVAALLAANLGFAEWHEHLIDAELGLTLGDWGLHLTLEEWVNDGLMALFFLLVGIEIKREIVHGELSTMDKAILPIVGALGGMMAPALIYAGLNWGSESLSGWGIPMATDIAFTLGILALLGSRVPASLKVFVSALAIADDLGAILVIALFYGTGFNVEPFLWALGLLAVMLAMNLARIYSRAPYVILGVVLWYFVLQSGLHATLAGVLVAAMIPSRPSASIEGVAVHARHVLAEEISKGARELGAGAMKRLATAFDSLREPGFHLQHALENWSNFFILPLFAFFNTGIALGASTLSFGAPEDLGVILGLVIGKPLGIILAVWLAVQTGRARLADEISWTQLIGAASLCGVGFTMSIFIASAAFDGAQLAGVKASILLASVLAAAIGSFILMRASPAAADSPEDV